MITYVVKPSGSLYGSLKVPGDKSISHRAVIFSCLASDKTIISGLLEGSDVMSTVSAFRAMGVPIHRRSAGNFEISGVGIKGLLAPQADINVGNSGTSLRLLCGLLAGQKFPSVLTGDHSLNRRPMKRVTAPLREMGASINNSRGDVAPVNVKPVKELFGIHYRMPIASAQVKSAILLAGMYASGQTLIREDVPTRDHTERMLEGFGYPVEYDGGTIQLEPDGHLIASDLTIPGDFSSAAFFIVAASITPGSRIELLNVGLNPTRTGLLDILKMMGAKIGIGNLRSIAGEPLADLSIESSELRGIQVPNSLVARTIDEFPALSIAAANAVGVTHISGAGELRFKESDRISVVVAALRSVGVKVTELTDGMIIEGGRILGGTVDSQEDHRVAMAFSVSGVNAISPVRILNCTNVVTSFPDFLSCSQDLGMKIHREISA